MSFGFWVHITSNGDDDDDDQAAIMTQITIFTMWITIKVMAKTVVTTITKAINEVMMSSRDKESILMIIMFLFQDEMDRQARSKRNMALSQAGKSMRALNGGSARSLESSRKSIDSKASRKNVNVGNWFNLVLDLDTVTSSVL